MLRLAEPFAFLSLAAGLHVLAFAGPGGGGDVAPSAVTQAPATVAVAPVTLAAMAADWDRPPDVGDAPALAAPDPHRTTAIATHADQRPEPSRAAPPAPSAAVPEAAPAAQDSAARRLSRPDLLATAPALAAVAGARAGTPQLPGTDTAPDLPPQLALMQPRRDAPARADSAPQAPPLPDSADATRPAAPPPAPPPLAATAPEPAESAAPAVVPRPPARPQVAAGTAPTTPRAAQPGRAAQAQSAARPAGPSRAERDAAQAAWGAEITGRIRARQSYPRGTRAEGTVRLRITVATSGAVQAVAILKGSGDAVLDRAALRTAGSARLPRAPQALTKATYSFTISLGYRR